MDELARRYLGLVLRVERRLPGMVETYAGPAELREAIAAEEPTPARELHDEALWIADQAAALAAVSPPEERRRRWLVVQAGALASIARLVDGEEIALPDLVESMANLPADREPESSLLGAHRLLDAALPPGPTLRARLAAHREATSIPAEHVPEAAERLTTLLRRRAHDDLDVPPDEVLALDPVHAPPEPWHAQLSAEPGARSRMALNVGNRWSLEELVAVIAGEGYPGRHAARVTRQMQAADGRHDEVLVWLRPAPEATLAAGVAIAGREVLLGDFELAGELRHVGHELGLRWDVERELEVARARERLAAGVANAALLLDHDGLPAAEVRAYLSEIALLDAEPIERVMALLEDRIRRVEPFARAFAPRLVREWLATAGQTDGLRRLLREQLTPAQLREESGVPA